MGKSTQETAALPQTANPPRREVLGLIAATATVLLLLALWSYDLRGGHNWIGPAGAAIAGTLASVFGFCAWLIPYELAGLSLRCFGVRRGPQLGLARAASALVFIFVGAAALHLTFRSIVVFGGHAPGGLLGEIMGEMLRSLLGVVGAWLICVVVLFINWLLRSSITLGQLARNVSMGASLVMDWSHRSLAATRQAWEQAKELEADLPQESVELLDVDEDELPTQNGSLSPQSAEDDAESDATEDKSHEAYLRQLGIETLTGQAAAKIAVAPKAKKSKAKGATGPTIVPPTAHAVRPKTKSAANAASSAHFTLPPTDMLDATDDTEIRVDEAQLQSNAQRLVQKLSAYGVEGRVDEIHPGPVVTMYEFEPASGTKVSKIAGLADDLAMALAAQKVRIVAPIVGKARVGFELPNERRQTVGLRDILEDQRWQDLSGALPLAIGKDIAGKPVYADLSKMPHLLVAGATGSGKSVGLNVMLASLLFKKTPDDVRLLMIDPKVVELAAYDGIPHMLLPVVTDTKKAARALRWAVDEMERRYQLFADAGARNVTTYNERIKKYASGDLSLEKFMPRLAAKRAKILADTDDPETAELPPEPEKLPHIVVVVDEFADLMMVAAKDVEAAIARLAQKARAAGIHVILATQRPSVDVITGMIKANFPTRIAFKVSQREDSKTILGRMGAEHLLGMGDMLMLPPGSSELARVHSAFISEDELRDVCDYLRSQGAPVYDERILQPREDEDESQGETGESGKGGDDDKYDRAVRIVADAGYCSISHIQRQLSVGYNKAAKIVERMEKDGIVGPPSGKAGGRREVLVGSL